MNPDVFHFTIGSYKCSAISDGTFTYTPPMFLPPAATLFGNAPKEQLEQELREHGIQPENWIERVSPYICLFVDTGRNRILIDTGGGKLGPNTGKLVENLKGEGISPDSIDYVIITHCHPDHIGGINLTEENLTFPNARYLLWKKEWAFWMSDESDSNDDNNFNKMLKKIAQKKLLFIQDRLELVDHEGELLPGIQIVEATGHTPGHIVVVVTSNEKKLFCIADTVLHPIHLEHPEWCAIVDKDFERIIASRRRIIEMASLDKSLVLVYHFPFPGLGYIVQKGDGSRWQPM